jgi:predicted nucleic acid-binding protein
VIFVDTNIFMYAVGRDHPLKAQARAVFERAISEPGRPLVTSAEVLQELLHAYLPVERMASLNDALELVTRAIQDVWPVEIEDVHLAVDLATSNPALGARDLIHLAGCQRRGIREIQTFDRALKAAFVPG